MQTSAKDKPGIKTSEFYMAAATIAIAAAANLGLLPETTDVEASARSAASAVMAIFVLWQYIASRTQLKQGAGPDRDEVRESLATIRELARRLPGSGGAPEKPAQ